MKKLLLVLFACIASVCAYANTCTFNGTQVTLKSEKVTISTPQFCDPVGQIYITVDDTSKEEVRCQVEVGGNRKWITVKLYNGEGSYNIGEEIGLPDGTYTVKLIQQGGMCY